LFKKISELIKKAVLHRGTTFSDYRDASGEKGGFFNMLSVYGRKGEKCPKCGAMIMKTKVAGRGTHFCQKCQK
jgi:formamidopyrimidine-DNA glycosylase